MKEERAAVRGIAAVCEVCSWVCICIVAAVVDVLNVAPDVEVGRGLAGVQRDAGTSLNFLTSHVRTRENARTYVLNI
jgi:hypothetical protein